jgi:hypothetical protein
MKKITTTIAGIATSLALVLVAGALLRALWYLFAVGWSLAGRILPFVAVLTIASCSKSEPIKPVEFPPSPVVPWVAMPPVPIAPIGNTTRPIVYRWHSVPGATEYRMEAFRYDPNTGNNLGSMSAYVTDTMRAAVWQLNLTGHGRWRIRAVNMYSPNDDDKVSEWTEWMEYVAQ